MPAFELRNLSFKFVVFVTQRHDMSLLCATKLFIPLINALIFIELFCGIAFAIY